MKSLGLVVLCLISWGCGDLGTDTAQYLNIEMYAQNETPAAGASGDSTPIWQDYTLLEVALLSEDTTETIILFTGDGTKTYKVVTRPQIIYSTDLSDYNGTTFAGITVTFDASLTGATSDVDSLTTTLTEAPSDGTLVTLEEGKGIEAVLKVKWKNTVSGSTMALPEFDLTWKSN